MRTGLPASPAGPASLPGVDMARSSGKEGDETGVVRMLPPQTVPSPISILKVGLPCCFPKVLSPTVFTAFCRPPFLLPCLLLLFRVCLSYWGPSLKEAGRGLRESLPSLCTHPLAQVKHLAAVQGIYFQGKVTHSSMK